jgi:hypothetical protein
MSKKRKRRSRKSRGVRPLRDSSKKRKKLSSFLREADGCLPTDTGFAPVSHDIIFVESGHFLTRKTRNRLIVAKAVLQGLESGSHLFGDDVPVPTNISYNELGEPIRMELAKRDIPVMEERPFLFDYEILGKYLPTRVRINRFYNAFIELTLNEWKINYARKLFVGFGFEEWGKKLPTPTERQLLQRVSGTDGLIPAQTGFNLRAARGLWFLSECIIRICAQWDKLIDNLVFDAYFSENPTKRFYSTIDKLEKYKDHKYLVTAYQKDCLKALVNLARLTERPRDWRDNDLHQFSETIFGVLEKTGTSHSLDTLWDTVVEEHNRVREATVAMIGMVVLGPQTTSLYHVAGLPMPTRYVDFDNPDIVAEHRQLVKVAQRKIELQQALQEPGPPAQKVHYMQEISAIDLEIKRTLYSLYGLSEPEDRSQ